MGICSKPRSRLLPWFIPCPQAVENKRQTVSDTRSEFLARAQMDAAKELLRRRRGRESLKGFANAIEIPGKPASDKPDEWLFKPVEQGLAAHHLLILDVIERAAKKPHGRFMLFLPPGSAKSSMASVVAPTYLMGKNPGTKIILACYGSDLARKHGRKARQIVRSYEYQSLFGAALSSDSSAADEWALTNGSEYMAAGLMAGLTGNRANVAIIDDPLRGREQADSPTIREKCWEAYQDDLSTRLIPGGCMGLITCMTGDTPVLLADGSEKLLRDIRSGDLIATYEAGSLSVSTVTNWRNCGPDSVYRIKTSSGASVKANGRHPFLVRKGSAEQWVRLKDLVQGDRILRAIGGSGEASSAQAPNAVRTLECEGFANRTTTNSDGLKGFARHLVGRIRPLGSVPSSSTDTESPSTTTSDCSKIRAEPARFARGFLSMPATLRAGTTFCASITAMIRARFGACSATTATSQSGEGGAPKRSKLQSGTYAVIPDEILAIEPVGIEEVFDVQVERTENFIANGLVSHNTRWHEDDLAGRLLPKNYNGESGPIKCSDGAIWEVVNLPAECERTDDPLGRKPGEMLWPEWFDEKHWQPFRKQARTWAALFQQRPRPGEGGIFKEAWCRERYTAIPQSASMSIHSWDTAQKPDQVNDPSVGVFCQTAPGKPGYFIKGVFRERIDYPDLKRRVVAYAERDKPSAILIEDKSSGQSLIQELRATTSLPIIAIEPEGSKIFRASEVSAMVEAGLLKLPDAKGAVDNKLRQLDVSWVADFESELFAFPLSTNDDQVDALSQLLKWAAKNAGTIESYGAGIPRTMSSETRIKPNLDGGYGSIGRGTSTEGF